MLWFNGGAVCFCKFCACGMFVGKGGNKWRTRGGENNKWKTRASCSMSSTCVVLFWRVAYLHGMVFAPRSCLCCPLGLHDEFACLVANADDDALAVEM